MEGDTPYLIMEFLPYGTLRRRHPEGSTLKPSLIASYIEKIADALDYAHSKGIIHRDIKPENILLNRRGELILSDFGIAFISQQNPEISQLSMPGVAGTYFYMAPEQWIEKPTYASDQYSLAVTVYEWLCGERPYRGSPGSLLLQHLNVTPPPLRARNASISPVLEEVVMKGLAKDAHQRYATVLEFAQAFSEAAQPEPKSQPGSSLPATPARSEKVTRPPVQDELPKITRPPVSQEPQEDIAKRPTHRLEKRVQPSNKRLARYGKQLQSFKDRFLGTTRTQLADPGRRKLLFGLAGAVLLTGAGGIFWLGNNQGKSNQTRGQVLQTLTLTAPATSVAWSPRGTYLAVGNIDSTIDIWEAQTAKHIYTYTGHTMRINDLAWSASEEYIASASDDSSVHVWKPLNGEMTQKYIGHLSAVNTLSWSPDDAVIASGSLDTTIQLWEPISGNVLSRYEGHSHSVTILRWSPHTQQIASTALEENSVLLWDVTTKQTVAKHQHEAAVLTLNWSPKEGSYLASGGRDRQVHIWKPDTGQLVTTYTGHTDVVRTIAWSKDATHVASGSNDHTVQIWQAQNSQHVYTQNTPDSVTSGLAWSPLNGTTIASGGDKTVQIWNAI
ncbi:hypothetical protein KSX_17380 [Ktedonospora formicarum]|uniref:Protein kinase domain-containing protein n=2 Tax=Ktedonospora formicarum TaxID=2778364 RepID=A0A8J3HYQ8_9CHLR|nr:hypothetical protein KSX_17380 [Ktedonospora formicarum]